jgi:hypothetical protein
VVLLVAVRFCPRVGAVALDTLTVVVALATAFAIPAVRLAAVPLMLVPVNDGVVVTDHVPLDIDGMPVLADVFWPVPPHCAPIAVPFQTPVAIVPNEVRDDPVMPAGRDEPDKLPAGYPVVMQPTPVPDVY